MTNKLNCVDDNGELLPKAKRFCELYSSGKGTPKECMLQANYTMNVANRFGGKILEYPEVKAYLAKIDSQCMGVAVASREDVLAFWTDTMVNPMLKTSDRLNASKLLAQYLKMMDAGDKGDDKPIIVFDIKQNDSDGDSSE